MQHIPILTDSHEGHPSVFEILQPQASETVLDVTLGLGGHAESFLAAIGSEGTLIGIEADRDNLEHAKRRLSSAQGTKNFIHANFSQLGTLDLPKVDIIFADLGLSSPHLDDETRGFSFRTDAPLDMRFDRSQGMTAAEFLNTISFEDLRRILRELGELREAGYIARAIVDRRETGKLSTTHDFSACVTKALGWRATQAMAQVFQAIRMALNDEMHSLEILLHAGPNLLKPGGRMGVISFHSLEDRVVKTRFRELTAGTIDEVTGQEKVSAPFALLTKRAIVPSPEEIKENPRSRSAKFRAIQRLV